MNEFSINNFRLSFIWFQPLIKHFQNNGAIKEKFDFLNDLDVFAKKCFELRSKELKKPFSGTGFCLPWLNDGTSHFWQYYSGLNHYQIIKKNALQKHLIPIREKPDFLITTDELDVKIIPEFYYFPFGVALVLTANIRPIELTLNELAEKIQRIKNGNIYTQRAKVKEGNNEKTEPEKLEEKKDDLETLSLKIMDRQLMQLYKEIPDDSAKTNPFILCSVIQAKEQSDPIDIKSFQGSLTSIVEWGRKSKNQKDDSFNKNKVKSKKWFKDNFVYCQKRGHMLWFPSLFVNSNIHKQTLSCYFRNQLMSAILLESYGGFLYQEVGQLLDSETISPEEKRCAHYATDIISRMYGGGDYRTLLNKRHIEDQGDWVEKINIMRTYFNEMPLK